MGLEKLQGVISETTQQGIEFPRCCVIGPKLQQSARLGFGTEAISGSIIGVDFTLNFSARRQSRKSDQDSSKEAFKHGRLLPLEIIVQYEVSFKKPEANQLSFVPSFAALRLYARTLLKNLASPVGEPLR
jgi:hypothetical protein